jgi:hypothetical protein
MCAFIVSLQCSYVMSVDCIRNNCQPLNVYCKEEPLPNFGLGNGVYIRWGKSVMPRNSVLIGTCFGVA